MYICINLQVSFCVCLKAAGRMCIGLEVTRSRSAPIYCEVLLYVSFPYLYTEDI